MSNTQRVTVYVYPPNTSSVYGFATADIDSEQSTIDTLQNIYREAQIELDEKLQVPKWVDGDTVQVRIGRLWFSYQFLGGIFRSSQNERRNSINLVPETFTTYEIADLWTGVETINVIVKDGCVVGSRRT
jgi:hypothetical protein